MTTIRCEKCEKAMSEEQFYMTRSRERLHVCKKCLTMHMDAFNPETFTWALEKLDVPYVPVEWNVVRDKKYSTNPKSFSTASVFGTYLAKMKLKQYKDAGWADSERLTAESEEKNAKKKDEQAERDLMYQNMYLNGSITENEYKTLVSVAAQKRLIESNQADPNNPYLGPNNPFDESKFLDKNEMFMCFYEPESLVMQRNQIILQLISNYTL